MYKDWNIWHISSKILRKILHIGICPLNINNRNIEKVKIFSMTTNYLHNLQGMRGEMEEERFGVWYNMSLISLIDIITLLLIGIRRLCYVTREIRKKKKLCNNIVDIFENMGGVKRVSSMNKDWKLRNA